MLPLWLLVATKLSMILPLVLQVETRFLETLEAVPLEVGEETIPRVRYETPVEMRFDGMTLPDNVGIVGRFRSLRILSLRGTDVEHWHLERWTKWNQLRELEFLDLSSTEITAFDLQLLTRLPSLKAVCLADVKLSSDDVSRFKKQYKLENGRELQVGYSPRGKGFAIEGQSGLLCCQADQHQLEVFQAEAATEAEMKPYEELIEHTDVKIPMVPIPGGVYRMGSADEEQGRSSDE